MWRGGLRVAIRQLSATLAVDLSPSPSPQEPCAQLSASTLALSVAAGRCDVTATGLSAVAHARSPDGGPCDPLLVLPLLHVPLLSTSVHGIWRLGGGRDAAQHHIFGPKVEGVVQDPLDIGSLVRAEGLSLGLDINLASGESARRILLVIQCLFLVQQSVCWCSLALVELAPCRISTIHHHWIPSNMSQICCTSVTPHTL